MKQIKSRILGIVLCVVLSCMARANAQDNVSWVNGYFETTPVDKLLLTDLDDPHGVTYPTATVYFEGVITPVQQQGHRFSAGNKLRFASNSDDMAISSVIVSGPKVRYPYTKDKVSAEGAVVTSGADGSEKDYARLDFSDPGREVEVYIHGTMEIIWFSVGMVAVPSPEPVSPSVPTHNLTLEADGSYELPVTGAANIKFTVGEGETLYYAIDGGDYSPLEAADNTLTIDSPCTLTYYARHVGGAASEVGSISFTRTASAARMISSAETASATAIYDMCGRRLSGTASSLPRGIYLTSDGRKFIIR